jgi:hypothetical protein
MGSDEKVEKTCQQIIEDKITIGYAGASDQPGFGKKAAAPTYTPPRTYDATKPITPSIAPPETTSAYDIPTFDVVGKNGGIKLTCNSSWVSWIEALFQEDKELIGKVVKYTVHDFKDGKSVIAIEPKKKQLPVLLKYFREVETAIKTEEIENTLEDTIQTDLMSLNDQYDETKMIDQQMASYNIYDSNWKEFLK